MNAIDLLEMIGDARDNYVLAAQSCRQGIKTVPKRRRSHRPLLIAAIIILILALVGCAVAIVMNLNSLKLDERTHTDEYSNYTQVQHILSLQGFVGSSNYQAAQEWYEFLQTYDPDKKILMSLSNKETMMPEEYWSYTCYTPEMTAKVDDICEKYGLNKQGMAKLFDSVEHFYQALNIDSIILEDAGAEVTVDPYYYYKTGSFMLNCETRLTGESWKYPIEYQLYCVMKSDFDEVYLNIGDIESYDQWEYTARDGTQVLLALSPDKALLIADKADSFVTMNILNPRVGDILYGEQMMTRDALEAFADTFDFSFTPRSVSEEDWEAVHERLNPLEEARKARQEAAMKAIGAQSYAGRIQYQLENASNPELLGYALLDINGDGMDELLIGQDDCILHIYTTNGNTTEHILTNPVGHMIIPYGGTETVMTTAASYMYLCRDNSVAYVYQETDETVIHHFARVENSRLVWAEEIVYDPGNGEEPYLLLTSGAGSNKGYNDIPHTITEERYHEILNSYVRTDVEWKPIKDFPLE